MLDNLTPAKIVPTVLSGEISVFVTYNLTGDIENTQLKSNGEAILIDGKHLRTERNYFVQVMAKTSQAEFSLMVT